MFSPEGQAWGDGDARVQMKDRTLRTASLILAGLGLLDSLYLTYVKVSNTFALCGPIGNCESVNTSRYSEIAGIPIAVFGAGAYLLMLAVLLLEARGGLWRDNGPLAMFGLSLLGVLYSVFLTYLELFVIRAICPYCVISAIILMLLLIIALLRLFNPQEEADATL